MAVTHAERVRLRVVFGGLAIVPLFLGGWFTWIQVLQKGDMKRPDGQREHSPGECHEFVARPSLLIEDAIGNSRRRFRRVR